MVIFIVLARVIQSALLVFITKLFVSSLRCSNESFPPFLIFLYTNLVQIFYMCHARLAKCFFEPNDYKKDLAYSNCSESWLTYTIEDCSCRCTWCSWTSTARDLAERKFHRYLNLAHGICDHNSQANSKYKLLHLNPLSRAQSTHSSFLLHEKWLSCPINTRPFFGANLCSLYFISFM